MKWALLLTFISILSFGQAKKCYDYLPITNIKGDTVYAFKECGKPWTINYPDKAMALMTAQGSKLFLDYLKLTNKMDSLEALDKSVVKRALNLALAWIVMLNSYQVAAQHSSPAGHFRKWVDIPSAPTLGTTTTIIPTDDCCGGATYNYTLIGGVGAGGDVIPNGNFNRSPNGGFGARQWDGDATHIYRVVPAAGTIFGSPSGVGHGFTGVDHGNYNYLYGLSAAEPGVSKGQFGVFFLANTAGGHWLVKNWVAKSTTAGSFQFNSDVVSGSYYDTVRVTFCRSFSSGQEGLYGGATHAGFAVLNRVYIKHFFTYNSTRESFQLAHVNSAYVRNVTSVGAGQGQVGSQDRNFQMDDTNGELGYSVFYNGFEGAQIFSHGVRIHHNFISFQGSTTAANIVIGRTDTQYFAGSSRLNGDSVIIENNCIKKEGTSATYAVTVEVRDAPVIFRNNTLDGFTTMFFDNRGATPPNTITGSVGDHGNVTGTCPTPTFGANYSDPDNYAQQGLLTTSDTWYLLHYGYRTPNSNP